jgi:hypothetical protein
MGPLNGENGKRTATLLHISDFKTSVYAIDRYSVTRLNKFYLNSLTGDENALSPYNIFR